MMRRIKHARPALLALALIAAALSLLHLRGILPGQTFLPVDLANNLFPWRSGAFLPLQNPLVTDPLFEFYPYLQVSIETLRTTGQWPLWNPWMFLGHPIIADPNAQPFYPIYMALGLLLGAARALAIGPWLHAILAGFFVFAWVRALGYGRRAAVLSAIIYAAGGQMVLWFGARQWLGTLTWLPGVLWALELFISRRRWGYLGLAALFQGAALLSGQYQVWLAFSLFLVLYAAIRAVEERRAGRRLGAWPLAATAAIIVLGGSLAAIQLLPSIEYLALSHRSGAQLMATAMKPAQLITLLVPDFYGNPATIGDYWGELNYAERTIYGGLVALQLALMAPLAVRRRRFLALALSALALAAAYFVVGGPGVERLQAVPGFQYLALARSAFLLSILIAVLAAMTLDEAPTSSRPAVAAALLLAGVIALAVAANWGNAQEHWQDIQRPVQRAGLFLLAATALLWARAALPTARRWIELALIGLVFLDLYVWGSGFNPAGPIKDLQPSNPATEFIQANAGEQRVAPIFAGWDIAFGPNYLSTLGVGEPGGYSSLVAARLRDLFVAGDPSGSHWNILGFTDPSLRLLDLFQVGYVASPYPRDDGLSYAEIVRQGCIGSTGEITAGAPQSGSFVPRDSAINRLDLTFHTADQAGDGGELLVRLWQGEGRERLVLEERQATAELADGQTLTWYFAPERTAPGQPYLWEVSAANGQARTGVSLCTAADGQPALAVYGQLWTQVFDDGIFYQQRSAPMPRAYVAYAAEAVASDQQAVERLLDPAFDLRNTALLARPVDLPAHTALPADRAALVEYGQTRVVVDATARQPGLLILGDLYHPGWKAFVDGQPAELLRANHVMRGVLLTAGHHRVEFRFQPDSLRRGALISLAALAGVVGLLLLSWRHGLALDK